MARNYTCIICKQNKGERTFVKHKNNLLNSDFSICKNCANGLVEKGGKNAAISICQLMNVAYIEKSYREIIEDAEGNFTDYLQKIAPYKKYVFFSDSVFTDNESQSARSSFVVTDEIMNKWGGDHTEDEYFNLEASLQNLINIKVPNTTFELMRYRQNVKLEAALNESLAEGDSNSITKLRKAYSDDLKDLGLDTLLNSKDDGTQTLGERTKDWESHAPIPEPKGSEDVENIKEYIEKWFVVPMKRVFGVATEEEVDSLYDERKKEE